MSYWSAKADLTFMKGFQADVTDLWRREDDAANWRPADFRSLEEPPDVKDDPDYQKVRERVAKGISRALRVATRLQIPVELVSTPPPVIAGSAPAIRTTMFEAILTDRTYRRIPRQEIEDDLNRTVGACEDEVRVERRHVLNPAWWLWTAFIFILRIPFIVLKAAGFNTEKFEDELWAKLLKVGEVVLIAYLLARLGLNQAS